MTSDALFGRTESSCFVICFGLNEIFTVLIKIDINNVLLVLTVSLQYSVIYSFSIIQLNVKWLILFHNIIKNSTRSYGVFYLLWSIVLNKNVEYFPLHIDHLYWSFSFQPLYNGRTNEGCFGYDRFSIFSGNRHRISHFSIYLYCDRYRISDSFFRVEYGPRTFMHRTYTSNLVPKFLSGMGRKRSKELQETLEIFFGEDCSVLAFRLFDR